MKIRLTLDRALIALAVVLIAMLVVDAVLLANLSRSTGPPELELELILDSRCQDCLDREALNSLLDGVRVEQRTLDLASKDARELLVRYELDRVPAAIIRGWLGHPSLDELRAALPERHGALVWVQARPPYTESSSGVIRGLVNATVIVPSACSVCTDLSGFLDNLERIGVRFSERRTLNERDRAATALIETHSIALLPALLLSEDALLYAEIARAWPSIGSVENGTLVLRSVMPPYLELGSQRVRGLVTLTALYDPSCEACYNVSLHSAALAGLGLFISEQRVVDANSDEGRSIIERYDITSLPTVVLSAEAAIYPGITALWPVLGSVESDGSYVFRNQSVLRGVSWLELENRTVVTNV